jgi:hypothetical protein
MSILPFPTSIPNNPMGWAKVFRNLNRLIGRDERDHWRIDSSLARASDQRLLPLVSASNKLSTQSVQPLTAADVGSTATVSIASHSVQFGFGTVAYGAGEISGLSFSTVYYIYADDPDYEGGAVTYVATTNANLVTAGNGRYYVGKVTTPANGAGSTGGGWGGGGGGGGSQIP